MNRDPAHIAESADDGEHRLIRAAWAQYERIRAGTAEDADVSDSSRSFKVSGYRVLGEIHRGGQGVVYQAIQESTQRKLAIKVLKEGPFADRVELARFEREIDVLSRLDHPHIVAIHDRGLSAGHAYYVMDYVAGRSIDAYVAGADLPVDEILRLFAKVCDAVNVAHLRGVIHRDLKPGNIRVDESGEPRILDFGLAKLAQDAAEASSARGMTLTGQFVGSLPWSSPEQAEGRSDRIDVRTDIYALGVILYQLLTRRFPYPVVGRIDDVVRHIAHTSPARPTLARPELDHDVELIVLKCLAKEPERRYQSAGELVRDIRHYLAHEPVSATSPSAGYRLRKFVQRNRGMVLAGAVTASALVLATVVSVAFGLRAAQQRDTAKFAQARAESAEQTAETRAAELELVAGFQQEQLAGIDAQAMGRRIRENLLANVRSAAERRQLSPEEIAARVAEMEELTADGDFTGLARQALADDFFKPALAAIDEQFADQPLVAARLMQTVASTLQELGLLEAALPPQEEALAIRRELLGNDHVDTLYSISEMGLLLRAQGRNAESERFCHEALAGRRRVLGDEDPDTLRSLNNLAALYQAQGKLAEAEPLYREALEQRRRIFGDDHPDTLTSVSAMGYLLTAQGRPDLAEPYYHDALEKRRRVLGEDHPHTLFAINNMAAALQEQRRFSEAEPLYREALEKRRRVLGEEHPQTLQSLNNLGNVIEAQERYAEAEPYYREALEIRRRVLGDDHPHTLNSIANMGALLFNLKRYDEAEPLAREALESRRRLLGDAHPDTLYSIHNVGALLERLGRLTEAEAHYREALAGYHRTLGETHINTLRQTVAFSYFLQGLARFDEAIALLTEVEHKLRNEPTGSDPLRLARLLIILGDIRTDAGDFAAAEEDFLEAHEILSRPGVSPKWSPEDLPGGLVKLYDAWHAAEPDAGHDTQAAEWRVRLAQVTADAAPSNP